MTRRKDNSGFIYLVHCEGFYKIGIATNLRKRVSNIQTSNPFKVTLVAYTKTENVFADELELHELFKDKRVRGEWFKLNDDDLFYLREILL